MFGKSEQEIAVNEINGDLALVFILKIRTMINDR
jgi:hypothetical protein